MNRTSSATLFVKDTILRNFAYGIRLGTNSVTVAASIDRVRLQDDFEGVQAMQNSAVTVTDSVATIATALTLFRTAGSVQIDY